MIYCFDLFVHRMIKNTKKWLKNKYINTLVNVLLVVLLVSLASWWMNRGSLAAAGQVAPDFTLQTLSDTTVSLSDFKGRQVLMYFFAPWCGVCRLSADNLNDLRQVRSETELAVIMVALSYESRAEVEAFVADLNLQVPVLLGTEAQMADYQIQGFPTYYVVDESGHLQSKSVGYSTEWGMLFRTR